MIDIIIYSKKTNGSWKNLIKAINDVSSQLEPKIFHTVEQLIQWLIHRTGQLTIAILFIGSKEELNEIVECKNLFSDLQVILILPDQEDDTEKIALKLHPKYFSYIAPDYSEISAVVKKMLSKKSIPGNYIGIPQ